MSPYRHLSRSNETTPSYIGGVDFLHRTRLREVAEDSHLLKTMFSSIMWMEGGPWTFEAPEFRPLLRPETRSTDEQLRSLEAYRDCLTKNAYRAEAASPTVVGKNPEFSKRIGLVREVFPEARFIYLPRNPLESLPSLLELIERIWVFTSDAELEDGEHGQLLGPSHARHMLEDSIRLHRRVDEAMAEVPERQKYVARFDDFFADPVEGVAEIVEQFDLAGRRDDFRQRVADRSDRVRGESERDRATPEDFGLERAEITEPLADYFDRWDFSR